MKKVPLVTIVVDSVHLNTEVTIFLKPVVHCQARKLFGEVLICCTANMV